jgi:succinyl-CoA synthetase beta subunit
MARKQISEFRAKTLIYQELEIPYTGISLSTENNLNHATQYLNGNKSYVVKVDQGIKKRLKKGLIFLNKKSTQLSGAMRQLQDQGYSRFIIEEYRKYNEKEQYLALERTRDGILFSFSKQGGIDIESNQKSVKQKVVGNGDLTSLASELGLNKKTVYILLETFDKYYFSFLEINPYIVHNSQFVMLDAAAEVDSTAAFFVNNAWTEYDFTQGEEKGKTEEEINIQSLAANSQAAFSLKVLNTNGSIFMMLSGGGASIVLADEVYNQGHGEELANYGEYSGNPNAEETYIYAKNVISLLLKSPAKKKVLIIAGGVANFTDVRITFSGLIKALQEEKEGLQKQEIGIFVRRGGPYQDEGLTAMKMFLEKEQLPGIVTGPELALTDCVSKALSYLK